MNPEQLAALEAVAGRQITDAEKAVLADLVAVRNDVAVAALLSTGRMRYERTEIGVGTCIDVMGADAGPFLDAVTALSEHDSTLRWGMNLFHKSKLDMSMLVTRQIIGALKTPLSQYANHIDALLQVGSVPNPVHFNAVSDALNVAEGRMTL
jgi:hypothetical protein